MTITTLIYLPPICPFVNAIFVLRMNSRAHSYCTANIGLRKFQGLSVLHDRRSHICIVSLLKWVTLPTLFKRAIHTIHLRILYLWFQPSQCSALFGSPSFFNKNSYLKYFCRPRLKHKLFPANVKYYTPCVDSFIDLFGWPRRYSYYG